MEKVHISWFIGLFGGAIIFFVGYILFSITNYKKRFKNQYDLRNYFPYELNYESKFADNLFGNLSLIMSMAFSLALFALGLSYFKTNGYLLVVMIAGALYSVFVALINFIPLKYLKTHLIFTIILFIVAFLTPGSAGLTAFNIYQQNNEIYPIAVMSVAALVALFVFGLIMNPKLSLNIKMNVATDENGNEYYVRPKYIVMAFTEWMLIFGLIISQLLYLLVIIALL